MKGFWKKEYLFQIIIFLLIIGFVILILLFPEKIKEFRIVASRNLAGSLAIFISFTGNLYYFSISAGSIILGKTLGWPLEKIRIG